MATRSFIAVEKPPSEGLQFNEYVHIYCHYDGYPTGVGMTLRDCYQERPKVERLIANGSISSLGDDIGCSPGYPTDKWDSNISFSLQGLAQKARKAGAEWVYVYLLSNEWVGTYVYPHQGKQENCFEPLQNLIEGI